jgi:hypothetical protein
MTAASRTMRANFVTLRPPSTQEREDKTQSRGECGAGQHPDKADTPHFRSARQPGDPLHQEFEIALDQGKISACLIGLPQC